MTMLYYFCYENKHPTGGNKICYRHVELLNRLGVDAAILHPHSTFRYPQLTHQPPIVGLDTVRLAVDDVLVLPEDLGPAHLRLAPRLRRIVFNQGANNMFKKYSLMDDRPLVHQLRSVVGCFAVSDQNADYLRFAFPNLLVERLILSLNLQLFDGGDRSQKQREICFITSKNHQDVIQVVNLLRMRGLCKGWTFTPIHGMSEQEVADTMRRSAIFLSFGHPEGICLANLEAMASGCKLIGYSGVGCREYFQPDLGHEIPVGDIQCFVEAVERSVLDYDQDRDQFLDLSASSQGFVHVNFSPKREEESLIMAIQNLLPSVMGQHKR